MAAGGSIGQQIVGYGGKTKIVGNRIGGSSPITNKFPSTGVTVAVINLNPECKHQLSLDIAGYTDIKLQLTRANVERIDASQASFSAGTTVGATLTSNNLGVIEEGHTAVKLTINKTASSPADDAGLLASLGARAVLSILDLAVNRDLAGNVIAPPYTGPVITSDEEPALFS